MTKQNYEKAMLFLQAWREAGHLGEQCMTAIAFALRNRQRSGWEGGQWDQIIQNCNRIRYNDRPPNEGFPDLRNPVLHRFLARIDGIYDGSSPDMLTSCAQFIKVPTATGNNAGLPSGVLTGKYWAELDKVTNKEFLERIIRAVADHPKTSTVGGLTFFA
jgi:hypothetical protein